MSLKTRLKYHERALKSLRASGALKRTLDHGRKGLQTSRTYFAPPPP